MTTKTSKYKVNYKRSSNSSYTSVTARSIKKGVWSDEYKIGSVTKKKKYDFTVTKTTNLNQKTVVSIDILQK